jgi:hydroxyethylthiazole kinase
MTITAKSIYKDIETIRKTAPLIHNITNYVVMNNTANALLALGASPVMAHALPEVEDMTAIAGALVINIGTLSDPWIEAMHKAAKKARERQIPIILDPVGVGATIYRTSTAIDLINTAPPSIIRGNASEIMALGKSGKSTKGVDSTEASYQALDAAHFLVQKFNTVVCISGETDYIVSEQDTISVKNGHPMMTRVTGLGCTASAICGAFAAVNPDMAGAAAHAMAVMGIAGEMAAEKADGPGTLQIKFIDCLYSLCMEDIEEKLKNIEVPA